MLYQSDLLEETAALQTAAKMCAAARTAPKAHGKDTLHTQVLTSAVPLWQQAQERIEAVLGSEDIQALLRISAKLQSLDEVF